MFTYYDIYLIETYPKLHTIKPTLIVTMRKRHRETHRLPVAFHSTEKQRLRLSERKLTRQDPHLITKSPLKTL